MGHNEFHLQYVDIFKQNLMIRYSKQLKEIMYYRDLPKKIAMFQLQHSDDQSILHWPMLHLNSTKTCIMTNVRIHCFSFRTDQKKIIILLFQDKKLSFCIILPMKHKIKLKKIVKNLKYADLESSNIEPVKINLILPYITVFDFFNLGDILEIVVYFESYQFNIIY